jgi:hypothetical protein
MLPAVMAVAVLVACGGDDDDAATTETTSTTETPSTSTNATSATTGSTGTTGAGTTSPAGTCDEDAVRAALVASGEVDAVPSFDITHLACAGGYGWAVISAEGLDSADVLLRVSDAGINVLNVGTSVCLADAGIPYPVAQQIAPPGRDPHGDCP